MKKRKRFLTGDESSLFRRIVRVMKLTTFILLISTMMVSASLYSQNTRMTLKFNEITFTELFQEIENQTEFKFAFSSSKLDPQQKVEINLENKTLAEILDKTLPKGIAYEIIDRYVVIMNANEKSPVVADQQQNSVSGTVTDTNRQPLPGVTVLIKGTNNGTVTNAEGYYSLSNIPQDAVLVFSFVGMRTQEVVVGSQTSINLVMEEESIGLEEVVAVGYGTLSRVDVTAAVSKVKVDNIRKMTVTSLDQILVGQSAGVQVNQVTGTPGGGATIRIRGAGSIGAGDDPLYVIDGFPITSGYNQYNNPLAMLSTDDIEAVTILKDASSTSIYGSRGANGVILITTKRARKGVTSTEFSATYGIQSIIKSQKLDVMSAEELAQFRAEHREDLAKHRGEVFNPNSVPEIYRNPAALGKGTDWYDAVTRIAPMQSYNLTFSKGNDDIRALLSTSYVNQQGVVKNTDFERISIRANVEANMGKVVTIGMNLAPSISFRNIADTEGHFNTAILTQSYLVSPVPSIYQDNGTFTPSVTSPDLFVNANPLNMLINTTNVSQQVRTLLNSYLDLAILPGLNFRTTANIDYSASKDSRFTPSYVGGFRLPPPQPATGYYFSGNTLNFLNENTLNFVKEFSDHKIDAVAGYTIQREKQDYRSINARDYANDVIETVGGASTHTAGQNIQEWTMLSYLGRINYVLMNKYILNATIRTDGSSRFGKDNRWGTFPSASFGWRISNESFFPELEVLDELKLRFSWGMSGNNAIGNYTYLPTITTNNYVFGNNVAFGKNLGSLANYNLGWEMSEQTNAGFDVSLVEGRISLGFDYYKRSTESMLQSVDVPISSGFSNAQANIGNVINKGIELGLATRNLVGEFEWSTDFNFSINRNEVIDIGKRARIISGFNITTVGEPMGMFYGYRILGLYTDPSQFTGAPLSWGGVQPVLGTVRVDDFNKDGKIDTNDQQILGNPYPDFIFGFSNSFKYKNVDLYVLLQGSYGNEVFDVYKRFLWNLDGVFNVTRDVKDRWRSLENPGKGILPTSVTATIPIRESNSAMVADASYLAIRNINLGYNFKLLNTFGMRAFMSVQNLAYLSNYKGNPEINTNGNNSLSPGINYTGYPTASTYSFGLNVKF